MKAMTRRPNPKALTDADRIGSVPEKLRQQMIYENNGGKGVGMKQLAQRYGIPERTVRVVIHDSKNPAGKATPPSNLPCSADLWTRPDLWKRHGIKGPCTPRMVSVT